METRRSILIVDDDAGAAEAFEPMLRGRGYDVRVAIDAQSGWTEVDRRRPAAIVLDLHLPVVDGVEFLRRIRTAADLPPIPVAVVTGDYLIDDRVTDELEALGARLYFKPLWEEDLIQLVDRLLESRRAPVS